MSSGRDRGAPVRFDERVVVVTGAGRGLGRAFALLLAERGARVVINDIGIAPDAARYAGLADEAARFGADAMSSRVADEVVREITSAGGVAVASVGNVADPDDAGKTIELALETFGRLDVVINNAGIVPYAPLEETTLADLNGALAVHVGGTFNITRAAWPAMRRQGYGRVLNVCSIEGVLIGNHGFAAYAAAKGALMGLTRTLAIEGADDGILVNGLLPGATTRGNVSVNPGYARSASVDRSPAMVAPVAAWLVHQDCEVTGRFYAATAGSARAVFTSAARGFQSPTPGALSLETVRDHWDEVQSHSDAVAPANIRDYNDFRMGIYREVVDGVDESSLLTEAAVAQP